MFYIWPQIEFWVAAGTLFGISAGIFHWFRGRRPFIRIPARIVSVVVCLLSFTAMSLVLLVLLLGCDSHLQPVLSPSGDKAARVETDDEGATGGNSGVAVYSHHGFSVHTVMYGDWRGVSREDLRWTSDSALEIHYKGRDPKCSDTADVHVTCIERPPKTR